MSHRVVSEPTRLVDRPGREGSAEALARRLLMSVATPERLSPARLATIRLRIAGRTAPRPSFRPTLTWVVVGVFFLGVAGVGMAVPSDLARLREAGRHAVVSATTWVQAWRARPSAVMTPAIVPRSAETVSEPVRLPAPAPTAVLGSTAAPVASHPTVSHRSSPGRHAQRPPPGDDQLAQEEAVLHRVDDLLRNPGSALAVLEVIRLYHLRFQDGVLGREADLAELNADVELGRRADALALLGKLEQDQGPRLEDLRALHGELLAQEGRCAEALGIWGDRPFQSAGLGERVLYDRASCFAALNRHGESRAAVQEYLKRYPRGRFANALGAKAIGESPGQR